MIRKLGEADRTATLALLNRSPALNLYMLGNIAANGFDTDYCEFWGGFAADGSLRGVINRYLRGWVLYGETDAEWEALAAVLDDHPLPAERLQDNPGGADSLLPYLRRYAVRKADEQTLVTLSAADFVSAPSPDNICIRRATLDDLGALIAFYADAQEMSRVPQAVERPLRDRRIWLACHGDEIRAAALTNAETANAAMIGGVYTQKKWRGQGLSKAVTRALCAELLAEGKMPVLYWHNPAAGAVYRRLGFREIGVWRSVWLEAIA